MCSIHDKEIKKQFWRNTLNLNILHLITAELRKAVFHPNNFTLKYSVVCSLRPPDGLVHLVWARLFFLFLHFHNTLTHAWENVGVISRPTETGLTGQTRSETSICSLCFMFIKCLCAHTHTDHMMNLEMWHWSFHFILKYKHFWAINSNPGVCVYVCMCETPPTHTLTCRDLSGCSHHLSRTRTNLSAPVSLFHHLQIRQTRNRSYVVWLNIFN